MSPSHHSLISLRSRCRSASQGLQVASYAEEFPSFAQLTLEGEDPRIICRSRNLWRQIIRNDAHSPASSDGKRRLFQQCVEGFQREQLYFSPVQGLLSPIRG